MSLQHFSQSNDYLPGTWKGLETAQGKSASFTCPDCRQTGALVDHEILANGRVHPSVVCPTEGCTFHKWIVLDGWSPNG